MVVKENQVNVACKSGRFDPKRQNVYYITEEFLRNVCVILRPLHLNMIDPVPIPQGHLKKIIPEDDVQSVEEQYSQESNGKRNQNTKTNTDTRMNIKTDTTYETEYMEEDSIINTDMKAETTMNVKPNDTSDEQQTEIGTEENEEGIDLEVIFTSDEEDSIF